MTTDGNCGRSAQRGSTTTMTDCLIFLSQIIWIGLLGLQKSVGMTEKGSLVLRHSIRGCRTFSTAIIVTALGGETFPLYLNSGHGLFESSSYPSRLGFETLRMNGWGVGAYDFDNDGYKDLFTANSHVSENADF